MKVVIDRIEDGRAVLVLAEDDAVQFTMPADLLPPGARGGDHLDMTLTLDRESREATKKKVEDLLKELTGKKGDA